MLPQLTLPSFVEKQTQKCRQHISIIMEQSPIPSQFLNWLSYTFWWDFSEKFPSPAIFIGKLIIHPTVCLSVLFLTQHRFNLHPSLLAHWHTFLKRRPTFTTPSAVTETAPLFSHQLLPLSSFMFRCFFDVQLFYNFNAPLLNYSALDISGLR